MIYTYGITKQGTYHIKNDLVCQDAHNIIRSDESCVVAAVADGLGSEMYSDIASKMAVKISTEYCSENVKEESTDEEILEVIRDSFSLAQSEIEKYAFEKEHDLDQYDTTLSLVVYDNDTVYYGQSGDSGIIVLTSEGVYKKATEQQRDEEGRVYPLCFGEEKWEFGKISDSVASVLLATDGIYDILFPVYIHNESVNIYVALAEYLMNPQSLHIDYHGEEYVKEQIERFIDGIKDEQVNDDKTVVVLTNTNIDLKRQSKEYYEEPDWDLLIRKYEEAWKRAAYPQLYSEDKDEEDESE